MSDDKTYRALQESAPNQQLAPVPELCKAVCPTHRWACGLHMDTHGNPHQHICGEPGYLRSHDFYADEDMYGNPIPNTRKES